MNVAIAGGTGFIGKVVMKRLVAAGHHVVALIRQGSLLKIASISGMESRYTYFDTPSQVRSVLEGCQAVINLAGIIRESKDVTFDYVHHLIPMNLVRGAADQGIRRFLQMSALGVESNVETGYFESKRLGETVARSSGLDWTIFRPSIVCGPDDHFVSMFAKMIKRLPVVPVIGNGKYRLQPVAVRDVAECFVRCLEMPETVGKTYDVAGRERYTFNEMLDTIGRALGRKHVRRIHQPVGLMRLMAILFGRFQSFPVTTDQIEMLLAENITDDLSYIDVFGIEPVRFEEGVREWVR